MRPRLAQSYREIAEQVKLPGCEDPKADMTKAVYNWLCDEQNGNWLIVLDNVDNASVFVPATSNGASPSLGSYVPPKKHGSVLITSRSKNVALQLTDHDKVVEINPMVDTDAEVLLRKKIRLEGHGDGVPELAAALDFMPLALVQAGAYIRNQGPRCSVQRYLEKFYKSDKNKTWLLKHTEPDQLRRDHEASHSILVTWQISFEHILETRSSAADLLCLMSFFDREGIPETLLRGPPSGSNGGPTNSGREANRQNDEDSDSSDDSISEFFGGDITMLRSYSFVSYSTQPDVFDMHALVQLATRDWLTTQNQLEQWKCQFITNLYEGFPKPDFENWSRCRMCFPHVKAALKHEPKTKDLQIKWAKLLFLAGRFAREDGITSDVEVMSIKARNTFTRWLGDTHNYTLACTELFSLVLSRRGQMEEAEKTLEEVMQTRIRTRGPEHKETLNSMANLATMYSINDQPNKAHALDLRVMHLRTRLLGPNDPETMASVANVAKTYLQMGQLEQAEELYRSVVAWDSRNHGSDHYITLMHTDDLAIVLWKRGNWKEAQQLLIPTGQKLEQIFGADSLHATASKSYLALTYHNEGRLQEAEELEVHLMEVKRRNFGSENIHTLNAMNNVGRTRIKLGRFPRAQILLEEVTELRLKILGPDHPETLMGLFDLTLALWMQGYWESADQLELQTLRADHKASPDGSGLTSFRGAAALSHRSTGNWKQVYQYQSRVIVEYARAYGVLDVKVLVSIGKLARSFKDGGKRLQAIAAMKKFLRLGGEIIGCMHPSLFRFWLLLEEWYADPK
ncbi:uncharacterized protein N0V89_011069 [Didymosphaeria variabile]|uniref:TPR-like protein n=1 Tax=Didymosphaeria variabile TaxID=1932322 RepID=A0A9W8XEI8_9PLEO|nr:uncharacterized protein N0V89_011069 [Didymosphaeria variabile]KAJ4347131.1 hypothetical protein N0V89_011069 [Didymosphaeria variabile]